MGLREWARRTLDRHENAVVVSLPSRERWALYVAAALIHPRGLFRHLQTRFRRWTILPGDRLVSSGLRLVEGEVVGMRGDVLVVQVVSKQLLDMGLAPDWPYSLPLDAVPVFETVNRSDWEWSPR